MLDRLALPPFSDCAYAAQAIQTPLSKRLIERISVVDTIFDKRSRYPGSIGIYTSAESPSP